MHYLSELSFTASADMNGEVVLCGSFSPSSGAAEASVPGFFHIGSIHIRAEHTDNITPQVRGIIMTWAGCVLLCDCVQNLNAV